MGSGPIEKYEGNAATQLRLRAENAETALADLRKKKESQKRVEGLTSSLAKANEDIMELSEKLGEAEQGIEERDNKIEKLLEAAGAVDLSNQTPDEITAEAQAEADKIGRPPIEANDADITL